MISLPILQDVHDVAEYQLCTGCGVCAYLAPKTVAIIDDPECGKRPKALSDGEDAASREAFEACPGIALSHNFDERDPAIVSELRAVWGPVYQVWEGHAGDAAVRHAGSSGGAASALALFAIERAGMHGVLHTGARKDAPYLNETVMSRTRGELLDRAGSRYAPASPCDGLAEIEASPAPCVFIGKPCDVAGLQRARRLRPNLDSRIGLTIAFFCAGTPSTKGTLELMRRVGVDDPTRVSHLRYRGNGWPGLWVVQWEDARGQKRQASLSYEDSWGFLQQYRQWRCYVCPDHTGEYADISVGDPWHKAPIDGEPGRSLIIARTKRGMQIIRAAEEAGYLVLTTTDSRLLPRSQPNLLAGRGVLGGRLLALSILGVPRPRFIGFPMLGAWLRHTTWRQKAMSLIGTWLRVRRRGLRRRRLVRSDVNAKAGSGTQT